VRPEDRHARVAVRKAFEAARRQLQDYRRRQRGIGKIHEAVPLGRVARLLPDGSGGFIEAPDGHEVYFHPNSVLNAGFGRLDIGSQVAFIEEKGDRGPQASTVKVVARRGAPVCGIEPRVDAAPRHRPVKTRRRVRES
jgi:cold shock CspA family protein